MKYPYIYKTLERGAPIFEGSVFETSKTIGGSNSFDWYKLYQNYETQIKWEQTKLSCMGKVFEFRLPQLNEESFDEEERNKIIEGSKNITQDLWNRFQNAVGTNNISDDKLYTFRKKFIKHRDVYERVYDQQSDTQVIFFVQTHQDQTLGTKDEQKRQNELNRELINSGYTEERYNKLYLKEMLDGKIMLQPYIIDGVDGGLSEDFINHPPTTADTVRDVQPGHYNIYGNYTRMIREFNYGKTNFFKKNGRFLQTFQYKIKYNAGWETIAIAGKRMGKTYGAIDDMIDYALVGRRNDSRPIRCIFVGLSKKKIEGSPLKYIYEKLDLFVKSNLVGVNSKTGGLIIYERLSPNAKKKQNDQGSKVRAYIDFIGALDDNPGIGEYMDFLLIDEFEKIPAEIFEDLYAAVALEKARLVMISTLNENAEKTRGYDKLIEGERNVMARELKGITTDSIIHDFYVRYNLGQYTSAQDLYERCENWDDIVREFQMVMGTVSYRFTGRDNERSTYEENLAAAEKLKKLNYNSYLAEFESVFPDESSPLNTSLIHIQQNEIEGRKFDNLYFTYDPANSERSDSDNRPLAVWAFDEDDKSETRNHFICLEMNTSLKGAMEKHIPEIYPWIQKMLNKRHNKPWMNKYYFGYDCKGLGTLAHTVLAASGVKITFRIETNRGYYIDEDKRDGSGYSTHGVGKNLIVEQLVQPYLNEGRIKIPGYNHELISEMSIFEKRQTKESKNGKTYITYGAPKNKQDGCISTMFTAIYMISEFLGKDIHITKEKSAIIKQQTQDIMAINDRELTEYEKEMYYRAKLEKEKSNQDSTKRMLRLKKYGI